MALPLVSEAGLTKGRERGGSHAWHLPDERSCMWLPLTFGAWDGDPDGRSHLWLPLMTGAWGREISHVGRYSPYRSCLAQSKGGAPPDCPAGAEQAAAMDSAKRQWQLQIIQEQRIEADAKTRRLQLEEQMERSEQVQRPVHDVSGQAPGWPVPWHAPPPGAAYGAGQYGDQWHQTQQGPVAVWIPMQGQVAGQAIPVQVAQHGQYQGSAAEHAARQQFSQAPPATSWAQQAAATEGQPSEAARPAMGPQSPTWGLAARISPDGARQ